MARFVTFDLHPEVLRAVETMGFEEPTPVQEQTIPPMLAGKDVIVQAQTGTGKTAAYGIPLAERVDPEQRQVQSLVFSPTRELALQVAVELGKICRFRQLVVLPIYGGQSYDHQIRALRQGVHIVVGTPGRLLDLLEKKVLKLDAVRTVIVDEADEMLAMGFIEDVQNILGHTPTERQTALFSATMPRPIVQLSKAYMRDPQRITLTPTGTAVPVTVEHRYCEVPRPFKIEAMIRLLDTEAPPLSLVFCATKQMVAMLAVEIQERGYRAQALHGDLSQAERKVALDACRAGRLEVLVATDVAARGLDIPEVTHVFNFDIPQSPDRYVHRIGRTGRAGRAGKAITLITPRERVLLKIIEKVAGARMRRMDLPTVAEAEEREREGIAGQLEALLQQDGWMSMRPIIEKMAQRFDPLDLAAAALSKAVRPRRRREIPSTSPRIPTAFARTPDTAARVPDTGQVAARGPIKRGGPNRPPKRPAVTPSTRKPHRKGQARAAAERRR